MATVKRPAMAGSMESSDAFVEIFPAETLSLEIESVVMERFGAAVTAAVTEQLEKCGVTAARVKVTDRGALDCVIKARVETAIRRAGGTE